MSIGGKKREDKKRENVKEKGRKGKEKREVKGENKGKIGKN
jgi:hypothetical protein